MAKYRIVSKGNIVTIKSKLSFGEQINEREINVFEQQIFRGCFRPMTGRKKDNYLHSTRCGTSYIISEKGCGGRNVFFCLWRRQLR